MCAAEPLIQEEEDWLSHFYIVDNTIRWHVVLVASEFHSYSKCYQLREKKLIDTIPLEQLCDFSIDACGQPIFALDIGKRYFQIE